MFSQAQPMFQGNQRTPYQALQGGGPQMAPVINPMGPSQQQEPQNPMMQKMQGQGMEQMMNLLKRKGGGNPMGASVQAQSYAPQGNMLTGGPMQGQTPDGRTVGQQYPMPPGGMQQMMAAGQGMMGPNMPLNNGMSEARTAGMMPQGVFPDWLRGMFMR